MKNPFKKKTADEGALDITVTLLEDKEKRGFFKRLTSKLFKYKLSFVPLESGKSEDAAATPEPAAPAPSPQEAPPPEEQAGKPKKEKKVKPPKEPKEKKEKKPKAKKEKKPKPQKQKKTGEEGENGKKKFPLVPVLIAAAVAVGGGTAAAVMVMGGGPTPEELFAQAESYRAGQEYDKAETAYGELLERIGELQPPLAADGFLGLAETHLAREVVDQAIVTLQNGFEATGDPRIQDKLDELTGEEEPEIPPDPEVVFVDAAFEKMLRQAMARPSGAILASELADIKSLKIIGETHAVINSTLNSVNSMEGYTIQGVFYPERGGIKTLADLANLPALTRLVVCYNQVEDISGISGLTGLETLGLYCNSIRDISAVSGLSNLRYLYIYGNSVESLAPARGLTGLRQIWAQRNQIADLAPLSGMGELTELFVGDNLITDVSPVAGLGELNYFYAENNQISDLSPLAASGALTDVSFTGNPVGDMSPVSHVKRVGRPVFGGAAR
jgi:hypothetical protein